MAAADERGFSTYGPGTCSANWANPAVVQHVDEVGHQDVGVPRLHAHGQLVAEIPGRRLPHAGDPEVLAQQGRGLHVEVVERHDAIHLPGPGDVADALQQVIPRDVARDEEELLDGLARPLGIPQLVGGQQEHAMPLPMALAQELVALLEGGDTQQCQCRGLRHGRNLLGSTAKKTGYTGQSAGGGGRRLAAEGGGRRKLEAERLEAPAGSSRQPQPSPNLTDLVSSS